MDFSYMSAIASFVSGLLGVGIAWGTLRAKVKGNSCNIKEVKEDVNKITGGSTGEPVYTRKVECDKRHEDITKEFVILKKESANHGEKLTGLQNFARYMLQKEGGLSLKEVNDILGNG